MPTLAISDLCEKGIRAFSPNSLKISNSQMEEKKTLYQTSNPSLREISFPNIPVKPASITAACNTK
jgi:hypothetical protein